MTEYWWDYYKETSEIQKKKDKDAKDEYYNRIRNMMSRAILDKPEIATNTLANNKVIFPRGTFEDQIMYDEATYTGDWKGLYETFDKPKKKKRKTHLPDWF